MSFQKWSIGTLVTLTLLSGLLVFYQPLLFEDNFHEVIPGQLYRMAQPSELILRELKEDLAIESILAVRPARPGSEWFDVEKSTAEELDLFLANVRLDPNKMPAPKEVQALIGYLDEAPRPILLHCRRGVDRTGLAASIALILEGRPIKEARRQLGMRYGYFSWFSGSALGKVLDGYERWLAENNRSHSSELFRTWVEKNYIPEFYRTQIEVVDFPEEVRAGKRLSSRVRVTNESQENIVFLADPHSGVHLGIVLQSLILDQPHESAWRSGLMDFTLAPDESTEIDFRIPIPKSSGPYKLTLDLVNESVTWFENMGSPKTVLEFEVLPTLTDAS